ncbi:MAG TPA: sensor domain-containing diguanylate cyclase [Gaiellaceae bacterium]|nr:sensor domain-containing diguanylate cyclase [Gaiellaceae bacterium]
MAKNQSTVTHLRGLLAVTSLVRGEDDLDAVLEAIARTIAECLGFGTVAINLYRPAWDDFQVTNVYGNPGAREALLGDARDLASWQPLLDERFLRRGAYLIPHEHFDWAADVATFVPDIEPSDDPNAWHPEDALMVPMRHTAGHLLGILSVDEPRSGRKPSDEELDVLVAVAEHAALAVEGAQAAADAARHRAALEQLLRVSSRLSETLDADEIFQSVCESVRDALGFQHVAVELVEPATGRLRAQAAVGWKLGDETLSAQMTLGDVAPLLDPEFEVEGCFLLPNDQARRRFSADVFVYRSKLNGRGPWAWNRHWLVVPLVDRDGATIGVIWADEPEDRLLPPRERLQALRLFANQAATAVALVDHVQELRFLADHDPLTRLLNRRVFMERLDSEAARADRSGRPFGLVLCDLDRFKLLNDSKGHLAGDEALRRLGRILVESLRRSDEAFRIGGDEFALVLPDTSPEAVRSVVERVAAAMEQAPEGALDGVRASFGAAAYPDDAGHPEALVHAADEALYEAKRAGEQLRFAA